MVSVAVVGDGYCEPGRALGPSRDSAAAVLYVVIAFTGAMTLALVAQRTNIEAYLKLLETQPPQKPAAQTNNLGEGYDTRHSAVFRHQLVRADRRLIKPFFDPRCRRRLHGGPCDEVAGDGSGVFDGDGCGLDEFARGDAIGERER